jgi:hypothetical protein
VSLFDAGLLRKKVSARFIQLMSIYPRPGRDTLDPSVVCGNHCAPVATTALELLDEVGSVGGSRRFGLRDLQVHDWEVGEGRTGVHAASGLRGGRQYQADEDQPFEKIASTHQRQLSPPPNGPPKRSLDQHPFWGPLAEENACAYTTAGF